MLGLLRRLRARLQTTRPAPIPGGVERLAVLERILDYRFRDRSLLIASLDAPVVLRRAPKPTRRCTSNERMEFLGDSVLSLVVNDYLYHALPGQTEGELTKMKSVVVSKQVLAHLAKKIDLGSFVLVSDNAQKAGVQHDAQCARRTRSRPCSARCSSTAASRRRATSS